MIGGSIIRVNLRRRGIHHLLGLSKGFLVEQACEYASMVFAGGILGPSTKSSNQTYKFCYVSEPIR